jgi:hypothetical protein
MEQFDVRKDPWVCTTPVGDPEMRKLILSYMDRIGISTELWRRCGDGASPYMSLYQGIMDGWNTIENPLSCGLKPISLKELMRLIEKILEDGKL